MKRCISCVLSKICSILNDIKEKNPKSAVNIVIESENEKDSYYLKKNFTKYSFFEDNRIFITNTLQTNFVIIKRYEDSTFEFFKFNDPSLYYKSGLRQYIYNSDNSFINICKLNETEDLYLSHIKIVENNLNKILLFDYNNKVLFQYDDMGNISDKIMFDKPYQFYKGDKIYLDTLYNRSLSIPEEIASFSYNARDSIYEILFSSILKNLYMEDSMLFIDCKPIFAKFNKDSLVNVYEIKLEGYLDCFRKNNSYYLRLRNVPNADSKSNNVLIRYDFKKNVNDSIILNKEILESQLGIRINNLRFITDIIFKNENDYMVISDIYKMIYRFQNKTIDSIKLGGRLLYNSEYELLDDKYENNKLYLTLKDRNNFFIQIYNLSNRELEKELDVDGSLNDRLISSSILKIEEKKITFVNRWKKKRWVLDYLNIN